MLKYLLATAAVVGLASAASAADIYAPEPVIQEPGVVIEPAFNWTGFYVGVQGGYGWTNTDLDLSTDLPLPLPSKSFDFDTDGWLAGVNIGADWQVSPSWVVGIMADYNWNDIEGDFDIDDIFGAGIDIDGSAEQDNSWNILARVGYLINPRTLVYVLGGYGQTDVDFNVTATGLPPVSASETLEGWTVGVGSEMMLTDHVSVKGEYRYTAWEDLDYSFGGVASAKAETDQHSILLGLNFRWGITP